MAGRLTGSPRAPRAAKYISERFSDIGLLLLDGTYLQPFGFPAGVFFGEENPLQISGAEAAFGTDWQPLSFSAGGSVEPAGVVFAGYGLVAVGGTDYDSFQDAAVTGKWVLVYRGIPLDAPVETRVELARVSGLRYKASVIKARGARGMIVAPAPGVTYADELPSVPFDAAFGQAELPAIAVGHAKTNSLLNHLGPDRADLEASLIAGQTVAPMTLENVSVSAEISITTNRKEAVNVVGVISSGGAEGAPPLIIGAHLDHLWHGEANNSLAIDDEKGDIHHGPDGNASGVAALIEIARFLQPLKSGFKRDVLVAAWSGEPQPISIWIWSGACVKSSRLPVLPRLQIGTTWSLSAPNTRNLDIERVATPFVRSDASSFYSADIPVLSFTTGAHAEYHTPRDTADKLNYPGLATVMSLVADMALLIAETEAGPDHLAGAAAPAASGRGRASVALGTIPQYADSDIYGIAIAEAVSGGPAYEAGLVGGDIIIGLAGAPVADIYDFMRMLNGLKPDETTDVTVNRDDNEITLKITPAARADRWTLQHHVRTVPVGVESQ